MSAPPLPSPLSAPAAADPADLLLPQLRRRASTTGWLGESEFLSSAATIALSRDLQAVITLAGAPQSPADLGRVGLSIRGAWDEAAGNLLSLANTTEGLRIWLRPTTDPWFEVAVDGAAASSWLAHPRTFTLLNTHLEDRLQVTPCYRIPGGQARTLFVTATRTDLNETIATHASGHPFDVTYSAGFPVPAEQADAADNRGARGARGSLPVVI